MSKFIDIRVKAGRDDSGVFLEYEDAPMPGILRSGAVLTISHQQGTVDEEILLNASEARQLANALTDYVLQHDIKRWSHIAEAQVQSAKTQDRALEGVS